MNSLVNVRLLRPWRRYKAGHVFKPTGMVRSFLLRARMAEIVQDDLDHAQEADVPVIETAMLSTAGAETRRYKRRKHG